MQKKDGLFDRLDFRGLFDRLDFRGLFDRLDFVCQPKLIMSQK